MTMQDAYQVMITLQLRAPNGHSNFYSATRGILRNTHRINVYNVNGRVMHGPWNSWGTISWSWNSSECKIWNSMGQSWYEWYNRQYSLVFLLFTLAGSAMCENGLAIEESAKNNGIQNQNMCIHDTPRTFHTSQIFIPTRQDENDIAHSTTI